MASADDHRRLYDRWLLELWNGDESVAEEILADDFVIHQLRAQPGDSEAVSGPQAGLEMVRMGRAQPRPKAPMSPSVASTSCGSRTAAWRSTG